MPTHQGRGAENILSRIAIKPVNTYQVICISPLHVSPPRSQWRYFYDIIRDEAHDATLDVPFEGDIDVKKLEKLINEKALKILLMCAWR